MNEAETRAELIDPALRDLGWLTEDNVKVSREFKINNGRRFRRDFRIFFWT